MKTKTFILGISLCVFQATGFGQKTDSMKTNGTNQNWKVFSEIDLGILTTTGGYSNLFGVRKGPHSFELGYEHFNAPSSFFSGTPEGFDMSVDYIYSVNYSYFWNGQTDKGFFTKLIYHNKKQVVVEKSSAISKSLYSDLLGLEIGYVWRFYKNFYIAPRVGALYYINSPQGKENNPLLVGSSYYDNKRHKTWDTYFVPTLSVGYSLPLK